MVAVAGVCGGEAQADGQPSTQGFRSHFVGLVTQIASESI